MSPRLRHFPESRPPNGGIAGDGALKLLGRPTLDALIVLVREAAQNAWDAKSENSKSVTFDLATRVLREAEAAVLRSDVFSGQPPIGVLGDEEDRTSDLKSSLAGEIRILTLTDGGTAGLGGPIQADKAVDRDQVTDFVDLVFNIGQPRDKELGGGSYGFGKTISFLISRCRTILIHTRTMGVSGLEDRIIGQAISQQYQDRGLNYTGRHWWGVTRKQKHQLWVEPLVGDEARLLAASVGLPALKKTQTGTTIAIIDPDFGGRDPKAGMEFIAQAVLWNFWPKLVDDAEGRKSMKFSITCDGEAIRVEDPSSHPKLAPYTEALRAVRLAESDTPDNGDPFLVLKEIRSMRPKSHLGWLALKTAPAGQADEVGPAPTNEDDAPMTSAEGFIGRSHHVALMRQPELIVKYLEVSSLPHSSLAWAGVFKASKEADAAYCEAEPPTHDDWNSGLITNSTHKRQVNVGLRELKNEAEVAYGGRDHQGGGDDAPSGATVADSLGHLMSQTPGTRPSKKTSDNPEGRSSSSSPKVLVSKQYLDPVGSEIRLCVDFTVVPARTSQSTLVRAIAVATAADRPEVDPPVGAAVPSVLGFFLGGELICEDFAEIESDDHSTWTVKVSQPAGVTLSLEILADPVDAVQS